MSRSRPVDRAREGWAARTQDEFQQQLAEERRATYALRLYVAGTNLHSVRAIENTRRLCSEYLRGKCELHVIDLYQQPALAQRDRILTVPVLVKLSPPPSVRFVGDMSDTDKILRGLGILRRKTGNK
ncbi:MAG TPA: circadian clock KaiB family protein [Terriglobales bacterium]|nr:circadian clock KaiB family protein [Terriglobales bacterium]